MSNKTHFQKTETPWGSWEVLLEEPFYKLKRIVVKANQRLSYQIHSERKEHWTIVQGKAVVTLEGKKQPLREGESIDIPMKAAHRIENPDKEDLIFVEIQLGTYFGEDDIVRLSDDYGRTLEK